MINVDELSLGEAEDLLGQLHRRLEQIRQDVQNAQDDRKVRITAAVAALDTLLGPVDAAPGEDSIRAVRAYGPEVAAANPAIAFSLILHGMEILTMATRDIAASLASEQGA